jgi:hypothetical protein
MQRLALAFALCTVILLAAVTAQAGEEVRHQISRVSGSSSEVPIVSHLQRPVVPAGHAYGYRYHGYAHRPWYATTTRYRQPVPEPVAPYQAAPDPQGYYYSTPSPLSGTGQKRIRGAGAKMQGNFGTGFWKR